MLAILREISVTCFFTSYCVVLVLEILRLWGRIPGRGLAVIGMMSLGLFTHVTYLTIRVFTAVEGQPADAGLLATWGEWLLMVALGMAVFFFSFYLRRPDTVIGLFFLPVILGTIGLALSLNHLPPFSRTEAALAWRSVHGWAMMIGTGAVLVGFLAGLMYLAQSSRLKRKRAGSRLRLPTLETLSRINRRCLFTSTIAVGVGVIAGFVMNLNRWGRLGWSDGEVLLSCLLFVWLSVATGIEVSFPAARQGRKIVYLTFAGFGFLVLAILGVLTTSHGQAGEASAGEAAAGRVSAAIRERTLQRERARPSLTRPHLPRGGLASPRSASPRLASPGSASPGLAALRPSEVRRR